MNPRLEKQDNKDPFIHSFTNSFSRFVLFAHLTIFPVTVFIFLLVSPPLSLNLALQSFLLFTTLTIFIPSLHFQFQVQYQLISST